MRKLALTTLAAIALVSSSPAQNTFMDTVTVHRPGPERIRERPGSGPFRNSTQWATNFPLRVFYRVAGSASNGVDYQTISGGVVIPEGSLSALIPVKRSPIP